MVLLFTSGECVQGPRAASVWREPVTWYIEMQHSDHSMKGHRRRLKWDGSELDLEPYMSVAQNCH